MYQQVHRKVFLNFKLFSMSLFVPFITGPETFIAGLKILYEAQTKQSVFSGSL